MLLCGGVRVCVMTHSYVYVMTHLYVSCVSACAGVYVCEYVLEGEKMRHLRHEVDEWVTSQVDE